MTNDVHYTLLQFMDCLYSWCGGLGYEEAIMTTATRFLIPIFRPSKLEAVKAMNALVERGFNIETPLTEVKTTLEYRGNYNYRRGKYGSKGIGVAKGYYCRLEGERRNG